MKKVIGMFVIIIMAIGMLFVSPKNPENNDVSMSGVMAMNIANAEFAIRGCVKTGNYFDYCYKGFSIYGCVNTIQSSSCGI